MGYIGNRIDLPIQSGCSLYLILSPYGEPIEIISTELSSIEYRLSKIGNSISIFNYFSLPII